MHLTRTTTWLAAALATALAAGASTTSAGGGAPAKPPAKPPPAALPGAVPGTATDEAGKPLEGVQVVVVREKPPGTWKATSDAKGRYFVKGVPPGPATVTVRARGRVPVHQDVTVLAGGSATVDAKLEPGVRFAGKVTDLRAQPIVGARVLAYRSSDDDGPFGSFTWWGIGGSGRSDAAGAFEVDGLAPGSRYKLRVTHPHHLLVDLPGLPAEPGGGHETLDVTLEDAAWITGVVVDALGKPVAGARVSGPDAPVDESGGGFGGILISIFLSEDEDRHVTDAQGRFEVGGYTTEEADVSASTDGFFDGTAKVTGLEPGKEKSGVTITLEPATAWIEGEVVDVEGKPVAGASVSTYGDRGSAGDATTDAQGRFRIEKVKSKGPLEVHAQAEGWLAAKAEKVALDSLGVRITLKPAPRIKVRVLGSDGKPLPSVSFVIRTAEKDEEGDSRSETTRFYDQPAAGLDVPLWEGEVSIDVSAEGYDPQAIGPWTLASGANEDAGTVTLKKSADAPK